jgi:putative pyruvate formate lyase activating enzyme
MSQYHPAFIAENYRNLGRQLYKAEYESVVEEMERLGFRNGYVQDMDSNVSYRPDFSKDNPFE